LSFGIDITTNGTKCTLDVSGTGRYFANWAQTTKEKVKEERRRRRRRRKKKKTKGENNKKEGV